MTYVQSGNGTWHREECQYSPTGDDDASTHEQLPVDAERCGHCLESFEFES
jgi:hypothetical protein